MKHFKTTLWLYLAAVAFCICTDVDAQVRRKTTPAKKTTPVQNKKTPQKVIPTFAFYGKLNAGDVYVGDSMIYYVEENDNNAVMGIDRKTGEKSVVIPGVKGVYEGARKQVIKKFFICGGRQLMVLKDSYGDDNGVYLYEGSVKQARRLENSMWLLASNKRYAFVKSSHRIDGKYCSELWDIQNLKMIQRWPVNFMTEPIAKIASDGSVWIWKNEINENTQRMWFGVMKLELDGKTKFYDLSTQPYVVENDIREAKNDLYQLGDYLYNRCYRRIYRINTLDPDAKWEEYAKIPATQNSEFVWYCIDSKANMLTSGSSFMSADYKIQYWERGHYDTPKALGTELKTGINEIGFRSVDPPGYLRQVDADDNFILLYSSGSELCIYNPKGVVGYAKACGTVIK